MLENITLELPCGQDLNHVSRPVVILLLHVHVGSSVGRALCLEYRVSWVRVPPEAAHFF